MKELKRYVLIENNEIIDTHTNDFIVRCKELAKTDEDFNCPLSELIEAHLGKIISHSDNVLDLIDRNNDLLKVGVLGYPNIMEAKSINGSFKDMRNILAIYKPNSKGDYIKAWERE